MKEINDLVGAASFPEALFVYENGGGGKCSADDISGAATGDSCNGKTTNDAKGNSVKGSGAIRTLYGFATCGSTCEAKLGAEKWYNVYKNYWNDAKYADTYVRDAFLGTNFYVGKSNNMRAEVAKKGVAYQTVWMYVLHEYEDAIFDCLSGNIYDNEASNIGGDSPHAWDEGWAFYAGSLEGVDGSGSGAMVHTLAEKRCADFGTCADGRTGAATANVKHLANARRGRNKILAGDCYSVAEEFDAIVDQMTVPLVQGMLKYAFKADPANSLGSCETAGDNCDKAWAEGWAFAAAVLPRLHYCDSAVATKVKANLDVAASPQMALGFAALKQEVEKTYPCLGITCADVGEFQTSTGVYTGMEKCADASTEVTPEEITDDTVGGDHALIAGYKPATDVVPHSKVDLDMKEINDLVGAASFPEALFVYENGGGGKCSADDISGAATGDSCNGKTTNDAKGNSVKGSGAIRTLYGFATCGSTCEAKLGAEKWYNVYKNYWNDAKYADTYVRDAFLGTNFYVGKSNNMRAEVAKKGVAYQTVWMYVLHEYEDAIFDCLSGNIYDNEASNIGGDSPHAWDEGWAFYAGSLEGVDGSGSGAMVHTLAEKRCADFGTCADGRTGAATANVKHLANARRGRNKILAGDCYSVAEEFDAIVDQMTVPLVQGMLKYAFKADPANSLGSCETAGDNCDKSWAEGWAFAAAVLPRLHYCSTEQNDVAKLVKENLDVAASPQMKDGFAALKAKVESVYECLGITCADVGEFQTSSGVYTGMEKCSDASTAPAPTPPPTAAPDDDDGDDACSGKYYDAGDLTATSAGSCYDMGTHTVTCNVAKDACDGSYYEPGYVSGHSGCCHCAASCGAEAEAEETTAAPADDDDDDDDADTTAAPTPKPTPKPTAAADDDDDDDVAETTVEPVESGAVFLTFAMLFVNA